MSSKRFSELRQVLPHLKDIKTGEQAVLAELALRESDKGDCYPSIRTIAKFVHATERAVQKWLKSLAEKGYVTISAGVNKFGHQSSNHYKITLPSPPKKLAILAGGVNAVHPNNVHTNTSPYTPQRKDRTLQREDHKPVGFAHSGDQPPSSHSNSRTPCSLAVSLKPSCEGGMPTVPTRQPFDEVLDSVKPCEISSEQAKEFGRSIAAEGHEEEVMNAAERVWLDAKLDRYNDRIWRHVVSLRRYLYDEIRREVGKGCLLPRKRIEKK